jgi:hypothetical protein
MNEPVFRAGCIECDWRYYAFSEARAINWADAHSEEEGHGVKVAALEQYGQVQMVSTYVHTRQGADELARLHRRAVYGENCDVYVAEVLERKS